MRAWPFPRKARSAYYGNRCQPPVPMTRVPLDPYVLDTLMPDLVGHDRQPSAFFVYLFLWRRTHGINRDTTQVALTDIAEGTGLSKRAVQDGIAWLAKRQLVAVARASITAVPVYNVLRPWKR